VAVEAVLQRFRYTARFFDADTGLYYYRARHYDAGTGRFNQEDPLHFGAGDHNIYRYVANNPVNFTDPSGMASAAGRASTGAIVIAVVHGIRTSSLILRSSYARFFALNATGQRYFLQTVRHNLDKLSKGRGTLGDLIAINLGGIAAVLAQVNSDKPNTKPISDEGAGAGSGDNSGDNNDGGCRNRNNEIAATIRNIEKRISDLKSDQYGLYMQGDLFYGTHSGHIQQLGDRARQLRRQVKNARQAGCSVNSYADYLIRAFGNYR